MGLDPHKTIIRALSGIIYIAIIVGCLFIGYPGAFILGVLLGIGGELEFLKITKGKISCSITTLLDLLGIISLAFAFWGLILIYPVIILLRLTAELWVRNNDRIRDLALSLFSQIYIGLPIACMSFLLAINQAMTILLIFILIWINDTGAFLIGCTLGRHKFCPSISPKKTWEGVFGGLIFSIIASIIFGIYCNSFFELPCSLGIFIGLGVIVSILSDIGDLFESMIKREVGIKDSGKIIPGHGGVLDRIDSFLFVMPIVALYIFIINSFPL